MPSSSGFNVEVCTTREAADILGLSVTTVQKLVEQGVLEAWKTQGGHRRVSVRSVRALAGGHGLEKPAKTSAPNDNSLNILIAEDDPLQKTMYEKQFSAWQLPFKWNIQENGYLALLDLGRNHYDVLILDIMMPEINGIEVIKAINTTDIQMEIAIVTGMEFDRLKGKDELPPNVVYFKKPISFDELRGYLRGCLARKIGARASF